MTTLHDKPLALVTGGARGIGRAIAERLCADGFAVVVLDRERDAGAACAAELSRQGYRASFEFVDLSDHASLGALVERLPAPSVLVNNAGIFDNKDLFAIESRDFARMMDVNVTALFLLSQAAAKRMKPGGKIVNIASRAYLGAKGHAHYVASKAAVVGLTRAMALELLPQGIMVNAVAPGGVETEMVARQSPEARAALLALQPTGALGKPADIANAVAFFASPKTDFIYGQVLVVDGGKSLGGVAV
ncbi:3-oxoacyl-[acyl-carrier protein] reductase [Microvirga flocculans]|uniref:3-oxoacyl-[acyl-carrier protein] reductase n=1 Tax=Microvirga flocculans TaxID=217168 RepID=A0A7W6N6W6_9HYPH|nr:SDR family NAD(P)-dependent oxidoreductase [Microvirga flocculans]MBB4038718.1 3-oxoacyl-[acyl-carrier protein] reductase [Microvirga flocculans]